MAVCCRHTARAALCQLGEAGCERGNLLSRHGARRAASCAVMSGGTFCKLGEAGR